MPPETPVEEASPRKVRLAVIVAAIIVTIIVITGLVMRKSDDKQLREWTDDQAIPTVALIKPGKRGNVATLDLPGRLEAFSSASLYARVSGYLKSWKVDIGKPVKAGQLLAEIETPDLDQQLLQAKADLASAEATAALAEITAKRWQSLLDSRYVSNQAVDEKNGDFRTKQALAESARANVHRLKTLKNFARIVAPFDGIITARGTDIGALINGGSGSGIGPGAGNGTGMGPGSTGGMGQELFQISNTRRLRVYVNVPQTYVPSIHADTQAKITVPERPGQTYIATVASSAQAVDIASGSTLMQILVDNEKGELLPGAFANVSFDLPGNVAVLSVPASALMFDRAGLRVATVGPDNKVVLKPVTIMRDLGKIIELGSGLAPDDNVIESPPDGIADGDTVRIAPAKKPDGAANTSGSGKGLY
ncbi:RND family efflux transporter, MFP subunit [Nitrosospira sp. Nsp18]|uniref:efflux RND transporter periplasmic adaptor subunit n=1 Tax=Nitrosospira sp. Nsp18 TaxID=1855334 RepID=UPI00088985C5|nr:efflux RND transporter periplasmic adaptor subunit [Nitrosospira sp. Nsp18]SDA23723.1 RND family efflux transporter, MFP subunit [Nitrosospira sp. Nsp18]